MKIFNAIVLYDVFVVAETNEAAVEALKAWIAEGLNPSEQKAMEARDERNIRQSWREQKPLIGADISDADFKKLKGKTTIEAFELIYKKNKP